MAIRMLAILLYAVTITGASFESTGTNMILIPGGEFNMGSNNGQRDERPVHRVHVDSFYISETEITIWEYFQCVQSGMCRMPFWWNRQFFPQKSDDISGREWLSLPVTGVSWSDAQNFCSWKGNGYRLPTEAEWEYAARGNSESEYFWGNTSDSAAVYAVIGKQLLPVKTTRPNGFGLYDMIGNAWEWCEDRYDAHYYKKSPLNNPSGPQDSKKFPYRVVRGGSCNEYKWNLRCANRSYGESFRRFDGAGFRICRSVNVK